MARVVVITGGGTGIGAACARLMRAAGDRVFITGRREAPLQAVADETGATALMGDAADGEVWRQRLLPAILDQSGGVDVLICSAGGMGNSPAAETSDRQWREALDGNLTSAFASVRACLPSLITRRGNVLFVASIASLAAGPQACGYVTAKHALIGLMRSVARDYGPQGVRANAVCPGWVTTPMADEEMHPLMQAEGLSLTEAYQRVCRDVPLRRPASPEEIAEACQFLCSPQAAIISGATLVYGQLPDEAAARLDAFSRVERGLPLTAVETRFVFARLDAQPGPLPGFTTALVGMRNQYTYSPTERYEHIYLNDNFYAWQCLDGVEKGLADVDRCHYVQVAEDLYLFVWREKIIPTLGVILIDLQQMRTDGKIMGYQGSDFGALSNFPVGASAKILNLTRHQE